MKRDTEFTKQQVLDHNGPVKLFVPHMEHQKSVYRTVDDVTMFVDNVFGGRFRPFGRVEGRQMFVCLLPEHTALYRSIEDAQN